MKPEILTLLKTLATHDPNECICSYNEELKPYLEALESTDLETLRSKTPITIRRINPAFNVPSRYNLIPQLPCIHFDQLAWSILANLC